MTLLSDKAMRAIVCQFDLPERRSKIASLLKQNEQLYCICRSTDSTRFMIACDYCDEWYHVDCVNLTKTESAAIKRYYCPLCVSSNPLLKIEYKPKPATSNSKAQADSSKGGTTEMGKRKKGGSALTTPTKKVLSEKKQTKCTCDGCRRIRNCGKCTGCLKRGKCLEKQCISKKRKRSMEDDTKFTLGSLSNVSDDDEDEVPVKAPAKGRGAGKGKGKEVKKRQPVAKKAPSTPSKTNRRPGNRRKAVTIIKEEDVNSVGESSSGEDDILDSTVPRQCYGPGCTELALPKSKYCREFCGIALAHARIHAILPFRLSEFKLKESIADIRNRKDWAEAKAKYDEAASEIRELLRQRLTLDKHLECVRNKELDSESSEEEQDEEGTMYCVSCGHEIPRRTCLKHMQKCFNKYEGKTTFLSLYKQGQIEGPPIFCDFFNASTKTYCKRLAVLCAEHIKQPKIGDTEFCGYPVNEFRSSGDPFGQFCLVRKKKCSSHFGWERLRLASIDMMRVQMYTKMDELTDKITRIQFAQKNRGSLMSLLLNSTFDHDFARDGFVTRNECTSSSSSTTSSSP